MYHRSLIKFIVLTRLSSKIRKKMTAIQAPTTFIELKTEWSHCRVGAILIFLYLVLFRHYIAEFVENFKIKIKITKSNLILQTLYRIRMH